MIMASVSHRERLCPQEARPFMFSSRRSGHADFGRRANRLPDDYARSSPVTIQSRIIAPGIVHSSDLHAQCSLGSMGWDRRLDPVRVIGFASAYRRPSRPRHSVRVEIVTDRLSPKTDGSGLPVVRPDGHAGGGCRLDLSRLGAVARLMAPACPVAGAFHRMRAREVAVAQHAS